MTADDVRTLVRPNDPDTSWAAASRQTKGKRAAIQALVYETLRDCGPSTDDELRALLGGWSPTGTPLTPSSVRTRRAELVTLGWVTRLRDSSGRVVKRDSDAGGPATVWRACAPGERTGADPVVARAEARAGGADGAILAAVDNAAMRAAIEDALAICRGSDPAAQRVEAIAARLADLRRLPLPLTVAVEF